MNVIGKNIVKKADELIETGVFVFYLKEDRWESSNELNMIFGIDDSFQKNSRTWLDLVVDHHKNRVQEYFQKAISNSNEYENDYMICRPDNQENRWIYVKGIVEKSEQGNPYRLVGTVVDITDMKRLEEKLLTEEMKNISLNEDLSQEQIFTGQVIDAMPDLFFYKNENGVYQICNEAFCKFLGRKKEDIIGHDDYDFFEKREADFFIGKDRSCMENGIPQKNDEWVTYPDGSKIFLETYKSPVFDKRKKCIGLIGISRDITEKHKREEEILHLIYHDHLTDLYNRRFIEKKIKEIDKEPYYPISVVIADINGLKIINDAFGQKEGDKTLRKFANIISDVCRCTSNGECYPARWGGDEFLVLLTNTSEDDIKNIYNHVRKQEEKVKGKIKMSVSLGYATKDKKRGRCGDLFVDAEDMMHRDKLLNVNSFRNSVVDSISQALYEKDSETEEHASRLKDYSKQIGEIMELTDTELYELEVFALLHDIGKIGINDSILLKDSSLDKDEWEIMKDHSEIGYRIVSAIPELSKIADYILHHHERWDGTGYPHGRSLDNIPLLSRIISVVDAFDAMTSDRSYRKAMSNQDAVNELMKNSGTQFDPNIVKIFVEDVLKKTN